MADVKITALPAAAAVTSDDLIPIVNDPGGTAATQKATASQLLTFTGIGFTAGTKIYAALVNQSGTSDPTATVLQNTLGGIPTYDRPGSAGDYTIDLAGAFTVGKTFILSGLGEFGSPAFVISFRNNVNQLALLTYDDSFTSADDILVNTPILILVFP